MLNLKPETRQRMQMILAGGSNPDVSNRSHNRLLRVKAGLKHVLTEVYPHVDSGGDIAELYAWLDEIYTIAECEEIDGEVRHA